MMMSQSSSHGMASLQHSTLPFLNNRLADALSADMPLILEAVYTSTTYMDIARMAYALAAFKRSCAQPVT